jgi:hypothetical protein
VNSEADREGGLYANFPARPSAWTSFLEKSHEQVMANYPAIHDALIDARRWESPFHYNGSFACKVDRAKPLPAISTLGQLERLVIRTLAMLGMSQDDREALIQQAYAEEKAAREASAAERRPHKPPPGGFVEVDLSSIQL